jgi:hypothetical protein
MVCAYALSYDACPKADRINTKVFVFGIKKLSHIFELVAMLWWFE